MLDSTPSPGNTPRVRFAPSPTGYLHVGGVRTALAVCGRKNAPPLFETVAVLGRKLCLARISQAEESLQSLA